MTTSRTRRGAEAVEAAIEEYEIRTRIDEPDEAIHRPSDHDLRWARSRIDTARQAAEADVITPDEALAWLAGEVGRDLPDESDEDDEAR